jgi:hypothetical protein
MLMATATLSLALALTACAQSLPVWESHDNPVPDACVDAYTAAVIVHARNHQPSDFDLAIAKCDFYADWKRAVATDPSAIGGDAMAFLASRCGDAEPLALADICISVNR